MSRSSPRALIVGGSVAGLFAANLLRAVGWEVAVFERTRGDLGDRGTGIGTRAELFDLMRRLGLRDDPASRKEVEGRTRLTRDGSIALELPVRAVTSAWSHIWRPLRRALPDPCLHDGKTCVRVEQTATDVIAHFEDGTCERGDLLVGADGLHSAVRAALLPALRPQYAGYVAWRGVVEARDLAPDLHEMMFRRMVFGCPDGELMLSIPMPAAGLDAQPCGRRCHFVWFRPVAEAALADLCTDASGRRHGLSIPPPLIRPQLIAALRSDARALLAPQLAALVAATRQVILQPIFDLASPAMVFERIVLIGDAAFVARPHVATGVMKAALDAECLADELATSGGELRVALARFDRARTSYGHWLVARGRHIGGYFSATGGDREARMHTLMREYGAAGIVRGEPIAAYRPS